MKSTLVCLLAVLFAGVGHLSAQEKRQDYSEARLKLRAEMMALNMAERYGLDEKQMEALTEANLEWLQKRGDAAELRPDGPRRSYRADRRHHRHGWRHGGCCGNSRPADCHYCHACGDEPHAFDCPYDSPDKTAAPSEEELEKRVAERKKAFEERRAARAAYEESLQKIMTEEQYKAYRQHRPGDRR